MSSRWLTTVGLVVLVAGVYGGYRVFAYTEHDPRFCKSCHLMNEAYNYWAISEHYTIDCHQCHHATKLDGLRQLWLTITKRPNDVGEHAKVPPEVCGGCHRSGSRKWRQIMTTAGHRVHVQQQKLLCLDCHAQSLHRFSPPSEICRKCHAKKTVSEKGMGALHCTNCHNFLGSRQSLIPSRGTCLRCHTGDADGSLTLDSHNPMQFECRDCHNPHRPDQDVRQRCRVCHAREASTVATLGPSHRDCLTCHQPHTWKLDGEATCRKCHEKAASQGQVHRLPGHQQSDLKCIDCHKPHQWKPGGLDACRQCHRQLQHDAHPDGWLHRHGRSARSANARCDGCHPKETCTNCHGGVPVPHTTDWPERHGSFAKRSTKACERCHNRKQFCDSCHQP